jgi:hypothetical protein
LIRTRRAQRLSQALERGPQASPLRRIVAAGGLVALLALATALWWGRGEPPVQAPATAAAPAAPSAPKFLDPAQAAARAPAGSPDGKWRTDIVGAASDLRGVIDTALASSDPQVRRHASTAWRACFPLFNAPQGQTRGVAAAMASLHDTQRLVRAPALQDLHARCRTLLALREDDLNAIDGVIRRGVRDETLAPAGEAVLGAWQRGDADTARALLQQTLKARDPAALYSLVGVASRLAPDRPDAAAIDLALLHVACDNGLNCERTSLPALTLCAGEGHCDGELYERWSRRSGRPDEAIVEPWIAVWKKALETGEFPIPMPAR